MAADHGGIAPAPVPTVGALGAPAAGPDNMTLLGVSYPGELDAFNYSDVLVLVNNNSQMSKDIGEYFAAARGIPPERVAYIDVPARQYINFDEYIDLRAQVKAYMLDNGLVNKVNYIVTTKGLPLRVTNPDTFMYEACVDEELALIFGSKEASTGNYYYVENPYYGERAYFSRADYPMYIVNRLTGYNWSDVKALIDHANETYGNRGLFVLDTDPTKGFEPSGYGVGNLWLRNARNILTERQQYVDGIEILYDETRWYVVGQEDVIGYGSWGSNDNNDTDHAKPHNTWVNGSVAETFVSTGGRTFNWPPSYGQSLIADIIREGVTGVKGYVQEPFLSAIAAPDILFERYTAGFNLAESYRMASIMLGWMGVVVGDPKVSAFRDVPDLVIADPQVTVSNLTPAAGADIEVIVDVDNKGGAVDNVTVELLVDGEAWWSGSAGFDTFSRTRMSIHIQAPTTNGTHTLAVRVNPTESLFETLTSNNMGEVDVLVMERPVISVSANPPTVLTQASVSIVVDVLRAPRNVTKYYYDLGDGSPLVEWTMDVMVHSYEADGTYVVTVHVVDEALVPSYDVSVSVVVTNREPFAAIDVTPSSALTGEKFAFDSTRSGDLDGTIVAVGWDFGDGNTSVVAAPVHSYARPGEYTVKLTVRDDDGATATTQRPVSVLNREPTASFVLESAEVWKGSPVTFNASASSDPDGRVLQYEWHFGDGSQGAVLKSPWAVHTFDRAGSMVVVLTVFDDFSATGTASMTVDVHNRLPVANVTAAKAQVLTLEAVDLDASLSSDEDGSIVRFVFTASQDGKDPLEVYTGDQGSTRYVPLDDGEWVFTVTVLDDDDGSASATVAVRVLNRPPTVVLDPATSELAGQVLLAPASVTLSAEASDVDGDVANVTWLLDDMPVAWGPVALVTLDGERAVRIDVLVVDDDGATAMDGVSLYINEAPVASFTAMSRDQEPLNEGSTVRTGTPVTFNASASHDAGGPDITFSWDMGDGTTLSGPVVEHAYMVPGSYTVRLTVRDDEGGAATEELTVTVVEVEESDAFSWATVVILLVVGAAAVAVVTVLARKRGKDGKGVDDR